MEKDRDYRIDGGDLDSINYSSAVVQSFQGHSLIDAGQIMDITRRYVISHHNPEDPIGTD